MLLAELTLHTPVGSRETLALLATCVVIVLAGRQAISLGWGVVTAGLAIASFTVVGNVSIPLAGALAALALYARSRTLGEKLEGPALQYALQSVVVLGGLAVYTLARYLVESDPEPAIANAHQVIEFEDSLGLYVEPDIQQWILDSEAATRIVNWVYSFGFLAITAWALLWLWVVDGERYRILRNALGISALLAIPLIALYPLAPPRLTPEADLIDTIAVFGREHAFANEYAAMPSLHVGWMAAVGFVLGASVGGWKGRALALSMGPLMLLTVIGTGNHYWLDGVVGAAFAVGAAYVLSARGVRADARRVWEWSRGIPPTVWSGALVTWSTIGDNRRALFSFLSLGGLLAYLLIAQRLTPGFTDFWGYLTVQVAVFLVFLVAGEILFERQGGLSWLTHGMAVACAYADVLGTDGNLYAMIDEYDKITHFAGVAALTACLYDCLRAARLRGWIDWNPTDRLMFAVAMGIALGIAWEAYEFLGDRVFDTTRVGGRWDTGNDIVSDSLGAILVALLLWAHETGRINIGVAGPRELETEPATSGQT